MTVFFVFSYEAGQQQRKRTDRFLYAHPFYCRAVVIMDFVECIRLKPQFYETKKCLLNLIVIVKIVIHPIFLDNYYFTSKLDK